MVDYEAVRLIKKQVGERLAGLLRGDPGMSQAQLENKVARYLHDSQALEDYWQKPITAEQLQAEIDRMANQSKQWSV